MLSSRAASAEMVIASLITSSFMLYFLDKVGLAVIVCVPDSELSLYCYIGLCMSPRFPHTWQKFYFADTFKKAYLI